MTFSFSGIKLNAAWKTLHENYDFRQPVGLVISSSRKYSENHLFRNKGNHSYKIWILSFLQGPSICCKLLIKCERHISVLYHAFAQFSVGQHM